MNRRLDFSPLHDRTTRLNRDLSQKPPNSSTEKEHRDKHTTKSPDEAPGPQFAVHTNEYVATLLNEVAPDALLVADDKKLTQLLYKLREIYPQENFAVTAHADDPFQDQSERWHFQWSKDIRLSGKLLVTLDAAIAAAKAYDIYHDSPFSRIAESILASLPDNCSPLLRRKVAAMEKRLHTAYGNKEDSALPSDPLLLRKVLTRFPEYIYTVKDGVVTYISDVLDEDPEYINNMSEAEIVAQDWKTYFSGDEGYSEFMAQHRLASRDLSDIPHPTEIKNGIVTKLTPTKFGVFDSLGRFRGLVDPRDGMMHSIEDDEDVQSLAQHSSLDAIASDVAFAFDLEMRDQLSQEFGFPAEHLTLNEQIALTGALRNITPETEHELIAFVQQYGIEGARAFLATAFDETIGNALLWLPEHYGTQEVRGILSAFSELVDAASRTADEIAQSFSTSGKVNVDIQLVRAELLKRGAMLLKEAGEEKMDPEKLTKTLEHAKADIALFTTIFRLTRKEHPELGFEDIRGVNLASQRGNELNPSDQRAMQAIALQNWMQQKPEVAERILNGLATAMQTPSTEFYLLKKDNDVAAFIRFDERPDGSLYGASLNVNPALRGSGIGESMMRAAIDEMAKHHVIAADVFPELPVGMKYVEDFGCVITGVESLPTAEGNFVERFTLRRDDARNPHYQKHIDSGNHVRIERFDMRQGTQAMIDAVKKAATRGEVATRYYTEDSKGLVRYLAFEPDITIAQEQKAA